MMRVLALGCLLSVSVVVAGTPESDEERRRISAEHLHSGIDAYLAGDHALAAYHYRQSLVYWGHIRAAANLCNLLLYGEGVEQDYTKARQLCEVAAIHEDPHALVMLGEMYLLGEGVPVDHVAALEYYNRAAAAGHPHGMYMLGGFLLESSPDKARTLLRQAAERGHEGARQRLSELEADD